MVVVNNAESNRPSAFSRRIELKATGTEDERSSVSVEGYNSLDYFSKKCHSEQGAPWAEESGTSRILLDPDTSLRLRFVQDLPLSRLRGSGSGSGSGSGLRFDVQVVAARLAKLVVGLRNCDCWFWVFGFAGRVDE